MIGFASMQRRAAIRPVFAKGFHALNRLGFVCSNTWIKRLSNSAFAHAGVSCRTLTTKMPLSFLTPQCYFFTYLPGFSNNDQ
jgi:hypothetical protein